MRLRSLILCALFAALTAVGSLVKIPVGGVMIITLQTFFMFLAGLMLEPKYAFFSQIVYMAIGLIGLPIFSTGGGISYMLMPTFGFVLGFCLCATLTSLLVRKNLAALMQDHAEKRVRIAKIVMYSVVSIVAMYIVGVAYMYLINNLYLHKPVTLAALIQAMAVFLLVDSIKFAVAIPLSAAVYRRIPDITRAI